MPSKLIPTIAQELKDGKSPDTVRAELLSQGHDSDEIELLMSALVVSPKAPANLLPSEQVGGQKASRYFGLKTGTAAALSVLIIAAVITTSLVYLAHHHLAGSQAGGVSVTSNPSKGSHSPNTTPSSGKIKSGSPSPTNLPAVASGSSGSGQGSSSTLGPTVFSLTGWTADLAAVIHSDVAQSVTLPSGKILWVFGDTVQVNGVSTVSSYGYPHDSFALQTPNSLSFSAVHGTYGYGWQQIPNWSDGTFFWASTPLVDNNTLYILGSRIAGDGTSFTVKGTYMASFNASTLAYEGIVAIPAGSTGGTTWGGVVRTNAGWWLTGSHNVCSEADNCKVGDMALVPLGEMATTSAWQVYNDVIPASANIGTTLAPVQTTGGWDLFTKQGDEYGGTQIERLTSISMQGPWQVTGYWSAPSPSGTVTYGVAVHPEQAALSGQVLVSYDVNGVNADCYPRFIYLPLN